MPLQHSVMLEIREAPGKGRGVFARMDIPEGTEIERVPLLILDEKELEQSNLMNYVFIWTKKTVAVALGYGSLYNHSYSPNARYYDGRDRTKVFTAIQDIHAGEEITVNYNGDPENKEKVEFDVIENGKKDVHKSNGKTKAVKAKSRKAKAATPKKTAATSGRTTKSTNGQLKSKTVKKPVRSGKR